MSKMIKVKLDHCADCMHSAQELKGQISFKWICMLLEKDAPYKGIHNDCPLPDYEEEEE